MAVIGKSVFILNKAAARSRLTGKQKLTIDDIRNNAEPPKDYFIYVQLKNLQSAVRTEEGAICHRYSFDEVDIDDDTPSGRRGRLTILSREIIDVIQCISLPAYFFLVNCHLLPCSSAPGRIHFFDIDLELGGEHSKDGSIYKIEPEDPLPEECLPLTVDYVALKEIYESPKLNVYGVIKAIFGSESKTRLTLTDPSIGYSSHRTCHLTSQGTASDRLPLQAKVGDVIRFHRISARKQHGNVVQLFGQVGKAGLSWLLFGGRPMSDSTPQSSSENFTVTENDYETVRLLRRWFSTESRKPAAERKAHEDVNDEVTSLSNFRVKQYGNLLIQVIGVFQGTRSTRPVIVRGWDGTICANCTMRVDVEKEGLPVYSYDKKLFDAVDEYVFDIFVYDDHKEGATKLKKGHYILIRNVHFGYVVNPEFAFFVHGGDGDGRRRGIYVLNENEPSVTKLKSALEQCISRLPVKKRRLLEHAEDDSSEEN